MQVPGVILCAIDGPMKRDEAAEMLGISDTSGAFI
jgi:hypothetical protein